MPHPDFSQRILKIITNAVSTFLLIVLFYILEYIFDMNFVCSCMEGLHPNGILYLAAPPMILTLVINILELFKKRKGISRWHCLSCSWVNLCGQVLKFLLKYISLSAVWISTVLFDGDWYFCLMTNYNQLQTGLPCKESLTPSERQIKDAYKTESLDYGFYVLCGFLACWTFVEIGRAYCIHKKTWKNCSMSREDLCPPYYSVVYESLLEEEVTRCLNNGLKEIAEEKAKAICEPYLSALKTHELPNNNNTSEGNDNTNYTVSETWTTISACDFYMKENNTQTNGERKDGGGEADSPMLIAI
ncbi:uncharacterized protein LOC113173598 [Anabas testudineus]|uniref:uncharacterized protein LOC113173598 n=1 Tax=Anabas testudineus TaxID=64144 RepID=UPI000E455C25|nr:uncharacterized protein LOC113173598 [Anabas testudineus]